LIVLKIHLTYVSVIIFIYWFKEFENCDSRRDNSYIHLFVILLENCKLGVFPITQCNNIKLDTSNVLYLEYNYIHYIL